MASTVLSTKLPSLPWRECHTRARTVGQAGAAPHSLAVCPAQGATARSCPISATAPLGGQQVTPEL